MIRIALAAILLVAADDPAESDLDDLRGTWVCVSMERNGRKVPEEQYKDGVLIMDGETFTFKRGDEIITKGTRKLDPTRSPKALDDTHTEGRLKGRSYKGIYELDGDTFKTCNGGLGADRPTEFGTKPGTGLLLIVYRRKK